MNKTRRRDTLRIAEEAAEWLDALESDGPQQHVAFAEWLRASPRHVEEFLLLTASDRAAEDIDPAKEFDVDGLIRQLPANVVPMPERVSPMLAQPVSRGAERYLWAAGMVTAAGIALLLWRPIGMPIGWQPYSTAVGEQRAVELADGSLIQLNTRSHIEVRFSGERRDIRLLEGEAWFKVARDASRPFEVAVAETVIRAVGTQFNVERGARGTTIAVLEGKVRVSKEHGDPATAQLLSSGEQARVPDAGNVLRTSANLTEVTAWRQRRLVFRDSTLAEIAAQFNRYNRTPQIVIEDETSGARRYGGTFDADDPQALIDFLRPESGLVCETRDGFLMIRSAP